MTCVVIITNRTSEGYLNIIRDIEPVAAPRWARCGNGPATRLAGTSYFAINILPIESRLSVSGDEAMLLTVSEYI